MQRHREEMGARAQDFEESIFSDFEILFPRYGSIFDFILIVIIFLKSQRESHFLNSK